MTTTTQSTDTGAPPVNQTTSPPAVPSHDGAALSTNALQTQDVHMNGEVSGRLLRSARWQQ